MRTSNPTLKETTFEKWLGQADDQNAMTLRGVVQKSFILLFLLFATSMYTWQLYQDGSIYIGSYAMFGGIGAFILAIVTSFKPEWSPVTAPAYALVKGLALGAISAMFEQRFPGIVFQAVLLTMGVFVSLLLVYRSGLVKVTENFKLGLLAATGGIFVIYLISFIGSFFGWNMPIIHESGWMGIGFSLFVVVIAALNLVLDFDFIEQGTEQRVPKFMEWYASFGLIVTLVWLYIEILRLLAKLNSRD
jgi:uncharacterized YccA/Bax inhibitor family protein